MTHPTPAATGITEAEIEAADAAARQAQVAARVHVRELTELPDLAAACGLFTEIWQPGPGGQRLAAVQSSSQHHVIRLFQCR